jgi:hypothetical protein
MTESKVKRMIVALTVGAVFLLVTLLSIMVYLMISIKVEEERIDYLKQKTAEYILLKEQGEETIEQRTMREWIEREAKKLDYYYPGL